MQPISAKGGVVVLVVVVVDVLVVVLVVELLVVVVVACGVAVEFIGQHHQQARPSMLLLASETKAMFLLSYSTIKIT